MGIDYVMIYTNLRTSSFTANCKMCKNPIKFTKSSKKNENTLFSGASGRIGQTHWQNEAGEQHELSNTRWNFLELDTVKQLVTESIVRNLIGNCGLPLHITENPAFRAFLKDIPPSYSPTYYRTDANVLEKLSNEYRIKMQKKTSASSKHSISLDLRTGRDTKNYMGCMFF